MRVIIAGGGTGGHVYPGIAVAEALKRRHPEVDILFVGTKRGVESRILPRHGYALSTIPARGLLGAGPFGKIAGIFALGMGVLRSLFLLRKFKPGVVLATGGFVSAPVGVAASLLRIPLVVQEQNSVPGATNRLLANLATEVHLNFAAARKHLRRKDNLRLTGNPLRLSVGSGNRTISLERFSLDLDRQTVFVFGGSTGAHTINAAAVDAIRRLEGRTDVQFIIQTGKKDLPEVQQSLQGSRAKVAIRAYLMQIEEAYAAADVIVCRAGAMTLSEVMACGLPSILIPYPHAAQDHQVANAREMVEAGASLMILDEDLDGPKLARTLTELLENTKRQREMSSNAFRMARFDASEKIAGSLERLAEAREKRPAEVAANEPPAPVAPPSAPVRERRTQHRRGGRRRGGRGSGRPPAGGTGTRLSGPENQRMARVTLGRRVAMR